MILAVHSYPGANATVARHFPYWRAAGFERIIGVATLGGGCVFPDGMESVEIGRNAYIARDHLPRRLHDTVGFLLGLDDGWTEAAIIEYDTVIFRPLPSPLPPGLCADRTGGAQPHIRERKGTLFCHNPWAADRATWARIHAAGAALLAAGEWENGSPDCWIGYLIEKYGIELRDDVFRLYTQNTIHAPWMIAAARAAYRGGAHAIHGIKDGCGARGAETLAAIVGEFS